MRAIPILALTAALLLGVAELRAAPETGAQTPETPPAAEGAGGTEAAEPAKPETGTPGAEAPPPESGPVALGDLTRDGFQVHATEFIPAEAVTRQSGKVSADSVIVTLQKAGATAVCFYTLKAYVGKKLATIPACVVHR